MPVEHGGEHAAEQHADASAAGGDEAEDAHRLRALGLLREERHRQREPDGGDDRAAEALDGARADQEPLRRRKPARERREGEQRDAAEEEAPVPNRSPRRPPSSRKPPKVRRYALTTHASDVSVKPRSVRIDGSATFTIVVSSTIISVPQHRTIRANQRLLGVISLIGSPSVELPCP